MFMPHCLAVFIYNHSMSLVLVSVIFYSSGRPTLSAFSLLIGRPIGYTTEIYA